VESPSFRVRHPNVFVNRLARYEARVVRTGEDSCWGWNGPRHEHGYGYMVANLSAHRFVWIHAFGVPPKGLDVMHKCHRPECSNPLHLRLGTRQENMQLSRLAGRLQRRMSLDAMPGIRARRAKGETLESIAKDFSCTKQAVRHMLIRGAR